MGATKAELVRRVIRILDNYLYRQLKYAELCERGIAAGMDLSMRRITNGEALDYIFNGQEPKTSGLESRSGDEEVKPRTAKIIPFPVPTKKPIFDDAKGRYITRVWSSNYDY